MDIATDVLSRLERIEKEIGDLKNELISLEQLRDKKRGAVASFIDASLQKKREYP